MGRLAMSVRVNSGAPVAGELVWREATLGELSPGELYALLALRQRVFVVEQSCAYLDADGYDAQAVHVWAEAPESTRGERAPGHVPTVMAAARLFAPQIKYEEACIGRVVTAPEARGTGLGRALIARSIAVIEARFGAVAIKLSAQAHLERLYGEYGFRTVSERYMEDDIPHVAMRREPSR